MKQLPLWRWVGMVVVLSLLNPPHILADFPSPTPKTQVASPTSINLTPKGYLTTPAELAQIKTKADQGIEPFASNVASFIAKAGTPLEWAYGTVAGRFIVSGGECIARETELGDNFLSATQGGHEVYRKVLAYYLTGNLDFAISAREKILDLTDTYGFGGNLYDGENQCILFLAFALPVWIQATDLLGGTPIWTRDDKVAFQNWLAKEVYAKVAWASRVRVNNWGTAGSLSAAMIADYVADRNNVTLIEMRPRYLELSPALAYAQHNSQQIERMNGVFRGDSLCSVWGIQSHGGIPDELRRGSSGCTRQWVEDPDSSLSYTTIQLEHLVFHAEFLRHRGDTSMYDNKTSDGKGSIASAILFVLKNPVNVSESKDWTDSRKGTLFVAYAYYGYAYSIFYETALTMDTGKGGMTLTYANLTHNGGRYLPEAPTLLSPPHRTHTTNRFPTFTWTNVPGVDDYRILIYNDDHSYEHKAHVVGRTYTPDIGLRRTKLQWRVRSRDRNTGEYGEYGGRFTLFIDDAPTVAESGALAQATTPLPATALTRIEAGDSQVAQNGKWASHSTDVASGGAYLYSSGQVTDTLSVQFTGQQIGILYVQHPNLHNVILEVDGIVRQTINTQGTEAFNMRALVDGLSAGVHTLRVYSPDGVIAVDAFLVEAALSSPTQIPTTTPTPMSSPISIETTSMPTLEATIDASSPTPTATLLPRALPFVETMEDGASAWQGNGNWRLHENKLGKEWHNTSTVTPSTLTFMYPVNLQGTSNPQLSFQSLYTGTFGQALVEISLDGTTWLPLTTVLPSPTWTPQVVDLTQYRGQIVYLRFTRWADIQVKNTENGEWRLDLVSGYEPLPQPTLSHSTPVPTATPIFGATLVAPTNVPPFEVIPTLPPAEKSSTAVPPSQIPPTMIPTQLPTEMPSDATLTHSE